MLLTKKILIKRPVGPAPLIALGALTVVVGGVLLATGGVSAQEHRLPTRPDSFAYVQVDTTDELVGMFHKNPQLRKNYARHFGIPESEVMRFVKEALVPKTLTASRKITTFGIRKSGKIYPVVKTLPAGTKVWATRSGTPVIKWICTNPIGYKMPGTDLPRATLAEPLTESPAYAVASLSAADIPLDEEAELAPQLVALETPAEPETVTIAAGPAPAPVPTETLASDETPAAVVRGGSSPLALIPLAGVVLAATQSKSSGEPGPSAIPEPSTVALLALAGLAGGAILRRRR
jgi:hypothetical protein